MADLEITPKLRRDLGKPLGLLIEGPPAETIQQAMKHIREKNPPLIVAVGDVVTANLLNADVKLDIFMIDDKTMREKKKFVNIQGDIIYNVKNPAGFITEEAFGILEQAFLYAQESQKTVEIFVTEGEEDLLGIPAVILAPIGTLIFYGQPEVLEWPSGLVMVEVTLEKKEEFQGYINEMKKIERKD